MEMGEDILSHALPPTVRPNAPTPHTDTDTDTCTAAYGRRVRVHTTDVLVQPRCAYAAEMPGHTPHHLHELNHVRGPAIHSRAAQQSCEHAPSAWSVAT